MAENNPQTLKNHARIDPGFHFFLLPVTMINAIISIVNLVKEPGLRQGWMLVLAVAAVVAVFKIRTYALKAQDRVIRLEERLRMARVLNEPLRSRAIDQLTESQCVALRFASDAELPELVAKALTSQMKNADIKKSIVQWRPDYFRI
jgi:hypothetical protein